MFLVLVTGVSFVSSISYDYDNPHNFYISKNVCEELESIHYERFYRLIKLRCDWNKFIDADAKKVATNFLPRSKDAIYNIYELEFVPSAVRSNDKRYKIMRGGCLQNMRLRSLSLKVRLLRVKDPSGLFSNL